MTVLPKAKFLSVDSSKLPLVQQMLYPETKIAVPPSVPVAAEPPLRAPAPAALRRRSIAMMFHIFHISLLLILFAALSILIYRHYVKTNVMHRYQGYCTIPIDVKDSQLIEPNYRVMPLRWSSEPDVQLVSTAGADATEQLASVLREELDIDGMVEKISVVNNGRRVNFVHDFNNNLTNIVDEERCFVMEMEPELVLVPEAFILSIEHGGEFDVSRVRSALRALLPAVRELAALPGPCRSRPSYRLRRDEHLVRKRTAEPLPPHDYVHFSGKHIHEIEIGNMEELLQYEKNETV